MRSPGVVLLIVILASGLLLHGQAGAVFKDGAAEATFRKIRTSVGHGEGRIEALQSLQLEGRSQVRVENGNIVAATVLIRVLLPDRYLRIDSANQSRMITGFAGKKLLTAIEDATDRSAPPPEMHDALRKAEEARLARFLLATVGYVSPFYFITFRSSGAVTGMGDPFMTGGTGSLRGNYEDNVVEGSGRDNLLFRLFVRPNGEPVRIEYGIGKGKTNTTAFEDRREVDGFLFPFRIVTTDGKRVMDEITLEKVTFNLPLTAGDFEVKR